MTTLEFIAALVDSLAWPAVVLVALLVYRRSVTALLPNLNRRGNRQGRLTQRTDSDTVTTARTRPTVNESSRSLPAKLVVRSGRFAAPDIAHERSNFWRSC